MKTKSLSRFTQGGNAKEIENAKEKDGEIGRERGIEGERTTNCYNNFQVYFAALKADEAEAANGIFIN